jgi:hypothetical protein
MGFQTPSIRTSRSVTVTSDRETCRPVVAAVGDRYLTNGRGKQLHRSYTVYRLFVIERAEAYLERLFT